MGANLVSALFAIESNYSTPVGQKSLIKLYTKKYFLKKGFRIIL